MWIAMCITEMRIVLRIAEDHLMRAVWDQHKTGINIGSVRM